MKNILNTLTAESPTVGIELTGAQAVMETFLQEGVELLFGYPGGAIMPAYDALFDYTDRIRHVLVRHEQGAVHAAQGYARVSGKTGVCMITSGPAVTNAITGMADALADSTPLVIVSGQVGSSLLGSDAFQETDVISLTQAVTKWNAQVIHPEEIPLLLAKAFYIARSGRPGPVLIDIPKDIFFARLNYAYQRVHFVRSYQPLPDISMSSVCDAARLIDQARQPLALVGQGVILGKATEELMAFLEKTNIPAACTLLGLSAVPTNHSLYVGMLGMHGNYAPNINTNEADLIIAIGMRFDDRVTSDTASYARNAKVIHMDIDLSEFNKNVHADVSIAGDVKQTLPMLTNEVTENEHSAWLNTFHALLAQEEEKVIRKAISPEKPCIHMGEVVNKISAAFDHDAIMVTDVGQHQMMAARYFHFRRAGSIVTSGGLGTMGFGLPAAIGVCLGNPSRHVILFAGDGGFQMTIQELGTIAQEKLPVKMVLLNNEFLGMVRQWQEMFFDSRYSFTQMTSPDYQMVAKGYGIPSIKVTKRENLDAAISTLTKTKGSFLLEVVVEQEDNVFPMIPPGASVSDIRLE
jgi:acetolactate synthase I/II/III large subunit